MDVAREALDAGALDIVGKMLTDGPLENKGAAARAAAALTADPETRAAFASSGVVPSLVVSVRGG